MENARLFFISMAVILVVAGTAHLFANLEAQPQESTEIPSETPLENESVSGRNTSTSWNLLAGQWKVDYKSEAFTGSVINDLKVVGNGIEGYTTMYIDAYGQYERTNDLVLQLKNFDGKAGSGIYWMVFEGESYEIPCSIVLQGEEQFKLSYEYYGYKDTEIWKKVGN